MLGLNPYTIGAAIVGLLLALSGAAYKGYQTGYSVSESKHLAAALERAEQLQEARQALENYKAEKLHLIRRVESLEAEDNVRVEVQIREVEKEVVRYITRPPDPDLYLDPQWVRIHNAATSDPARVPEGHSAFPTPDGRPATAGAVLSVVARNYALYHKCVAEHRALRSLFLAQQ